MRCPWCDLSRDVLQIMQGELRKHYDLTPLKLTATVRAGVDPFSAWDTFIQIIMQPKPQAKIVVEAAKFLNEVFDSAEWTNHQGERRSAHAHIPSNTRTASNTSPE